MLSSLKDLVKQHQSDIILTLIIVLIALVSFGAGLLITSKEGNNPIIIQNPENSFQAAVVEQSLSEKSIEGMFVASKNGTKYHWPDCPWAEKISEENQVWFSSEEEAQAAGYTRCSSFEKYAP
jgi:hypothetical protein